MKQKAPKSLHDELDIAKDYILDMEIMPSMRALWSAGEALDVENVAAYNCAYTPIEDWKDIADTMYILMCGAGVGFSVEHQYTDKLPVVPKTFIHASERLIVEDSREGWASSLEKYLNALTRGSVPLVDYSRVRPAGSPLHTFGGQASGPEPLKELFDFIWKTFDAHRGQYLQPIDVYDIMSYVANTVVAGGTRRSATISFSDLDDYDMMTAKDGEFWKINPNRSLSNNSVIMDSRTLTPQQFEDEWNHLANQKSGERGIVFKDRLAEDAVSIGREYREDYRLNPCLTGDTKILTDEGEKPIVTLAKKPKFNIVNKDGNVTQSYAWYNGTKDVYEIKSGSKVLLRATGDHRLMDNTGSEVLVKDAKGHRLMPFIKEPEHRSLEVELLMGFLQGDGTLTHLYDDEPYVVYNINKDKDHEILEIIGATKNKDRHVQRSDIVPYLQEWGFSSNKLKDRDLPKYLVNQIDEDETTDVGEIAAFLSGLFSANGSVISKHRVSLKTSNYKLAVQTVGLLKKLNIVSYITTNKEHDNEFPNGIYRVSESYDVSISRQDSLLTFANKINFIQKYKQESLRDLLVNYKAPLVTNVIHVGQEAVYDFTEPETHWGVANGYICHNCGEVILRPRQFCNLSEVIVRPYDTKRTLKSKVAFATLLGTLQSTLTDFHFIKDDWKKNSEEERLLGVSLTGLKDHPILQKESSESRRILASLRSTATKWSKVYAHELGINEPASVTSVKPSGTVSQLVNSSSGLHPRWSKYYKRRVENSKDHPLSKWLIDQGVEYEESMYRDSSYVFTFYIEAPDAIFSGDESALEQVKYWKMLKTMYTTHNPSVTILVRPHEWEDLGLWVYNNKPSGMSFLPLDDTVYDQSPFEAISKQEYDLKKSQQPKLDFSIPILEFKDTGKAAGEQGCSGGSCVFGE